VRINVGDLILHTDVKGENCISMHLCVWFLLEKIRCFPIEV